MTAVEWLVQEMINNGLNYPISKMSKMIEQAKEMEKQQILDAFTKGADDGYDGIYDSNKEQYYTSTYGSKGSDEQL